MAAISTGKQTTRGNVIDGRRWGDEMDEGRLLRRLACNYNNDNRSFIIIFFKIGGGVTG